MSRSAPLRRPAPAITLLALLGLIVVAQLYLPLPLLPDIARAAGVGLPAAGLVASLFGAAYAIGFLVFGPLSDRIGRKPVMIGGLAALAAASLAVAAAANRLDAAPADARDAWWQALLALRMVQGFAAAALPLVALAWLGEALPPARRAFGIACMASAFLAAGILGQVWGATLGSLALAVTPAAAAYAAGAGALTRLPDSRPADAAAAAAPGGLLAPWKAMPAILVRPALAPAYLAALILLMSFVAFYAGLAAERGARLAAAGWDLTGVRLAALPAMLLPLAASRAIGSVRPGRCRAAWRWRRPVSPRRAWSRAPARWSPPAWCSSPASPCRCPA